MEPPIDAIDIGYDHRIVYAQFKGETSGINYWHRTSGGDWCKGWVDFKGSKWSMSFGPDVGWTVVQKEPLTLAPSLACRVCGDHGFIQNGKWVRA